MAEKKERQRITRAAVIEFIVREERKMADEGESVPFESWQSLRALVGLPPLTKRDLAVIRQRLAEEALAATTEGTGEWLNARRALLAHEMYLLELDEQTRENAQEVKGSEQAEG